MNSGRRLYRSRRERILLGVCGGIARYFHVDPVVVRVLWVLLSLTPFPGIIAYIVAAIVIPEEPAAGTRPPKAGPDEAQAGAPGEAAGQAPAEAPEAEGGSGGTETTAGTEECISRRRTVQVIGFGLVAVGAFLLLRNWAALLGIPQLLNLHVPWLRWGFWGTLAVSWWPLIIIAIGALILLRGLRSNRA